MKPHFSEADLLETYYTQPGESMPVMMHLARCSDCAARYERLDRKLREAASCHVEKPETFWTRQRISIQRRIAERSAQKVSIARTLRIAAALSLAFFLGGAVVYKSVEPELKAPEPQPSAVIRQPVRSNDEILLTHDAWQSDELKDFHAVVEWEAWVDTKNGGQS
jgi:anti-sigma factor RsiW